MKTADIIWNHSNNTLYKGNATVCKLQDKYGQYVIDYRPLPEEDLSGSAFAVQERAQERKVSARPQHSEAIDQTWHYRLGHANHEAISHLPTAVEGAAITGQIDDYFCETCHLAKAKQ